eukprot:TRINITY_DN1646_c0_g1_i4.p1 TRINITY_DN1646_c0_g1~~TRINITY_DN1646_c0_g1_i4.p1  ORF type:complete len:260 (+),score=23.73 TRINITY_DN1646_c0_g1_i4:172-951(+)
MGPLSKIININTLRMKQTHTHGHQECAGRGTRFRNKALTCGICFNFIELQGKLDSCRHEFCFNCIRTWSQRENSCPHCKRRFYRIQKKWKRKNYNEEGPRKRICMDSDDENVVKVLNRNQAPCVSEEQSELVRMLLRYTELPGETQAQTVTSLALPLSVPLTVQANPTQLTFPLFSSRASAFNLLLLPQPILVRMPELTERQDSFDSSLQGLLRTDPALMQRINSAAFPPAENLLTSVPILGVPIVGCPLDLMSAFPSS